MCTASWSTDRDGYTLCFNRDEQRSRSKAEPMRASIQRGVAVLSPRDPQGGGSWIAVNEYGLTVMLLNHYEAMNQYTPLTPHSRGALPLRLAAEKNATSAMKLLEETLEHYPPFILICLEADGLICGKRWDGSELTETDCIDNFVTTSSYESSAVQSYRRDKYREYGSEAHDSITLEKRIAYHSNTEHANKAFNPMMTRSDAETQSLSVLQVGARQVRFSYCERVEGDRWGEETTQTLARL